MLSKLLLKLLLERNQLGAKLQHREDRAYQILVAERRAVFREALLDSVAEHRWWCELRAMQTTAAATVAAAATVETYVSERSKGALAHLVLAQHVLCAELMVEPRVHDAEHDVVDANPLALQDEEARRHHSLRHVCTHGVS